MLVKLFGNFSRDLKDKKKIKKTKQYLISERSGFYFFPNKGRLFDKINIKEFN